MSTLNGTGKEEGEIQERMQEVVDFEARLKEYGVQTSSFGKGKARSIDDLYWEVHRGESYLGHHNGKFKRLVSVLRVEIWANTSAGDKLLVHTDERLEDKRIRKGLNERIAKKMSHDESVEDALLRALATELRLDSQWQSKHLKIERMDESLGEKESGGCPGISTIYHFHNVYAQVVDPTHEDCRMIGLPEATSFYTEELTMLQNRKHRWDWFTSLDDDTGTMRKITAKNGENRLYFNAVEFNDQERQPDSPESSPRSRTASVESFPEELQEDEPFEKRSSKDRGGLKSFYKSEGESCPYVVITKGKSPASTPLSNTKIWFWWVSLFLIFIAIICGLLIRYF